jgi:hypothetical protein
VQGKHLAVVVFIFFAVKNRQTVGKRVGNGKWKALRLWRKRRGTAPAVPSLHELRLAFSVALCYDKRKTATARQPTGETRYDDRYYVALDH